VRIFGATIDDEATLNSFEPVRRRYHAQAEGAGTMEERHRGGARPATQLYTDISALELTPLLELKGYSLG